MATQKQKSASRSRAARRLSADVKSLSGSWLSYALVHPARAPDAVYCGGTVIDPQWVLTAAHCVTEYIGAKVTGPTSLKLNDIVPGALVVREGVWHLESSAARHTGRLVQVAEIRRHEKYTVTQLPNGEMVFTNDIALLRLAQPAEAPRQVLARRAGVDWFTKPGTVSTVVGFGRMQEGGAASKRMMQVDVPIITEQACKTGYPMMDYAMRLCAGFDMGGKDSCQGDSGGPLFVRDELKQPVQVGIVSYGHGCAAAKAWGVYSSVGAFEDWIKERVPNAAFSDQGTGGDGASAVVMTELQDFVSSQPTEHPSQLAQVTVDVTPSGVVRIGEALKVRVTSSVDGRLVVFNRNEAGRTTQIFPNDFIRTSDGGLRERISAGETIEIPGADDKFVLRATAPAGLERSHRRHCAARCTNQRFDANWQRHEDPCRPGSDIECHSRAERGGRGLARSRGSVLRRARRRAAQVSNRRISRRPTPGAMPSLLSGAMNIGSRPHGAAAAPRSLTNRTGEVRLVEELAECSCCL